MNQEFPYEENKFVPYGDVSSEERKKFDLILKANNKKIYLDRLAELAKEYPEANEYMLIVQQIQSLQDEIREMDKDQSADTEHYFNVSRKIGELHAEREKFIDEHPEIAHQLRGFTKEKKEIEEKIFPPDYLGNN